MEDNSSLDEIFGEGTTGPAEPNKKKPRVFKGAYAILIAALIIVLVGVFVAGFFIGKGANKNNNLLSSEQPIVDEVYEILREHYIEDVSKKELQDDFAAGFSSVLDKYTGLMYSSPVLSNGVYGMTVASDMYSVKTVRTVAKNGVMNGKVQRGDILLEAKFDAEDWLDVKHLRVEAFTEMVKASSRMALKVQRGDEVIEIYPTDKGIPTSDDAAYYMDTPFEGYGYINLSSFDTGAAYDFMVALEQFYASGNHILMLDVRDNPGGTNIELSHILPNFIASPTERDQILNIKTRKESLKTYGEPFSIRKSDTVLGEKFDNTYIGTKVEAKTGKKFRLIIMANDGSASATEAFIGNIRHYMDGADYLLLGESDHTFGKGIAQQDFPLKSKRGMQLHVTVGKYYILGTKGTADEMVEHTIHGKGYRLDNQGIVPEIKGNIFEESIVVKAVEKATLKWAS